MAYSFPATTYITYFGLQLKEYYNVCSPCQNHETSELSASFNCHLCLWLTTTCFVVRVQGVVSWTSTDKTTNRHCQTEMGAMPITGSTLIPASLPRRMEDQDIHYIIQVVLDDSSVLATGFIGTFNATPAPIRPIDVILILSQTKWMRQVICYNITVEAYCLFF